MPGVPEVFYEPTGKEPCPRPLGEDHGMVVFDYMPTSPVNYFRYVLNIKSKPKRWWNPVKIEESFGLVFYYYIR